MGKALQQMLQLIWYLPYIFIIILEGMHIWPFVQQGHYLSSLLQHSRQKS